MIFKNEDAIRELWSREYGEEDWVREEDDKGNVKVTMYDDIFIFDRDFIISSANRIIKLLVERKK